MANEPNLANPQNPSSPKVPEIPENLRSSALIVLFDDKVNQYYDEKRSKHDPDVILKALEFWDFLAKTAKSDFRYNTVVLVPDTIMPKFEDHILDEILDVLYERYGISATRIHVGWRFHIPFFKS